jgi:hypothetical protein
MAQWLAPPTLVGAPGIASVEISDIESGEIE